MPIRARLTIVFAVATLLLLAGGGLLFVVQLRDGLVANLDGVLTTRAAELRAQIGPDGSNFQDPGQSTVVLPGGAYGQVLRVDGSVLESSDGLGHQALLTATQTREASSRPLTVDVTVAVGASRSTSEPTALRVLAVGFGRQQVVLAVAISRRTIDEAVQRTKVQLLLAGLPILALITAGAWFLARAALRPIEGMRRQAVHLHAHDDDIGSLAVPPSNDEVARLARTFNDLLSRRHEALVRQRNFIADAGHELRTPLTVLTGELELANRPGRSLPQLQKAVGTMSEQTERLVRLAQALLDLSQHSISRVVMRSTDLVPLLTASADAASALASVSAVTITCSLPPSLAVACDPDRIRQAIDNVVTNAIRAAAPGGHVSISARTSDNRCVIQVRDDGPGFPAEFLPVAFERFTRADQARTRKVADSGGSGLGLAIVKAILTSHGGDATAQNNHSPPGAVIVLWWPLGNTPQQM